METYRVLITDRASAELEAIHRYISQDSAANADGMLERLVKAIEGLEMLPRRYRVIRHRTKSLGADVRSMPVRPYLVRYRVEEAAKTVAILHVRHGAKRPRRGLL